VVPRSPDEGAKRAPRRGKNAHRQHPLVRTQARRVAQALRVQDNQASQSPEPRADQRPRPVRAPPRTSNRSYSPTGRV
jgi:hypothetical protein